MLEVRAIGKQLHSLRKAWVVEPVGRAPARPDVTAQRASRYRTPLNGLAYAAVGSQRLSCPGAAMSPPSASVRRRRRRHIAQELIVAVTFDRGQVVRDQPARPFDCDLDTVL